jgi:hypothetical protein
MFPALSNTFIDKRNTGLLVLPAPPKKRTPSIEQVANQRKHQPPTPVWAKLQSQLRRVCWRCFGGCDSTQKTQSATR